MRTISADLMPAFPWAVDLKRERVDASGQFRRQQLINHAMALDPALSFEGGRHDIDPEMRLAARSVAGMAFMKM